MTTEPTTDDVALDEDTDPADEPAADDSAGGQDVPPDDEPTDDDGEGDENPNSEAARYRRRLRDAEAERDALAGQLDALRRAEVERLANADGLKPEVLHAAAPDIADLLADDGTVDPDKVGTAIADAREKFGLRKNLGNVVPREGTNPTPPTTTGMVDVIMGNND